MTLLLIAVVVGGAVWLISSRGKKNAAQLEAQSFEDAMAEARRWTERLGGQVMNLAGTDTASSQALADAAERFTAANSALARATTATQANLARESALEGLHYVNAAREIMGLPAGPELPPLEGQRKAGKVTEKRTVEVGDGQSLTASPHASEETPNYYPGGMVAGRPVPAGWYSRPWWADALSTGVWMMGYSMMFNAMFAGMAGVGYTAAAAESGDWAGGGLDGDLGVDGAGEGIGELGEGGDIAADGDGEGFFGGLFGGDGDGGGMFDFDFDF
ncbi:DUF1542 domain-containing protein [Corynebacterium lizhenjunii]|uniref:DUF1542 domain-containing protein n=1 Tax=Corynebacterium lizhenjunii TaxID=2709394 RepID=A0A7T0P9E2_9CORY|nr:DUF1542 domain-containing protein [Corynebacterium lizhenjunii]QPK78673.1 DUF1542 domain-containing protein [Corynebacterium lizhenjunii]